MIDYYAHPKAACHAIVRNWRLILSLTRRDLAARYRGSTFGFLWAFINPMLMLIVYTFVFSVVFKARWGTGSDSKTEFALLLFIGLIAFNIFAECVNQAPNLVINNTNYVKKVVFPLEILPIVNVLVAVVNASISLLIWFCAYIILFGVPSLTILLLPLVLAPLLLFILGLCWILASLGVYIRDVSQFVGIAVTVTMFMSPIFYPATALPESYRFLIAVNPVAVVIEQMRDVLFWDKAIDWFFYPFELAVSLLIAWLGFAWFQKTRKGFADVL